MNDTFPEGKYIILDRSGNPLILTLHHSNTTEDGYAMVVMRPDGTTFTPSNPKFRKDALHQIFDQVPR